MKKVLKFLGIISAVLAVLAFVFLAIPAYSATVLGSTTNYSGYSIAFGTVNDAADPVGGVVAAFVLLLLGLLAVVASVVLGLLGKGIKFAKLNVVALGGGVLLLVSAILFFCGNNFAGLDSGSFIGMSGKVGASFPLTGVVVLLSSLVALADGVMALVVKE